MKNRVSKVGAKVSNEPGCLYVVATPMGNRGDITLRAIDTLRQVDRVLAEDTRHTRGLLTHLGIDTPLQSLHEHNEDADVGGLVDQLRHGARFALVSDAGTPLISDPGYPLVRACRTAGIVVVAIPGPSAAIAALSVAGLPTDRFRFEGFLPRKPGARRECLRQLSDDVVTLVLYESCHRILDTLRDAADVLGADRPAVLARELTKRFETVLSGTLSDLVERVAADPNQQRGEMVLLIAGQLDREAQDHDDLLRILLAELPVKQAAAIVARYGGRGKNEVYQRALALQQD
jgi:16S rRNA (cytidine1402-2'-O)-methyltransferase